MMKPSIWKLLTPKNKKSAKGIVLATILMGGLVVPSLCQPAEAVPTTVKVIVDGKELQTDQPAVIRGDRTLVPFRAVFSALGAEKIDWNAKQQKVTGTKGDLTVGLIIGKKEADVNGLPILLDAPAQIINDRTMVPLRFVSTNLGAKVEWDGVNYVATVNTGAIADIDGIFGPGVTDPALPVGPTSPVVTPVAGTPPAKDTMAKSNALAGTFVGENLNRQRFAIQFNSAMTMDIKNLTSQKESKGAYTVSGNGITFTSDLLSGSYTMEQVQYNGRNILLLKDSAGGKNMIAFAPAPYEDFVKIWTGQKK